MYRALYEYKSTLPKYLNFKAGDMFTIINMTHGDWFLAQNGYGEVGYVPRNYIQKMDATFAEVIKSIDRAIEAIYYQTSEGNCSDVQRSNLQKLHQHRKRVIEEYNTNQGGGNVSAAPNIASSKGSASQTDSSQNQPGASVSQSTVGSVTPSRTSSSHASGRVPPPTRTSSLDQGNRGSAPVKAASINTFAATGASRRMPTRAQSLNTMPATGRSQNSQGQSYPQQSPTSPTSSSSRNSLIRRKAPSPPKLKATPTEETSVDDFRSSFTEEDFEIVPRQEVTSQQQVSEVTPQQQVSEVTPQQSVNEMTSQQSVNQVASRQSVNQVTSRQSVNLVTSRQSVNQVASQRNVNQMTSQQSVNQVTSRQSVNQAASQQNVNQVASRQSVNQVTSRQSVNQVTSQQSVNQVASRQSVNQVTSRQSVREVTSQQSVNQVASRQSVNQVTSQQSVNQVTSRQSVNQVASQPSLTHDSPQSIPSQNVFSSDQIGTSEQMQAGCSDSVATLMNEDISSKELSTAEQALPPSPCESSDVSQRSWGSDIPPTVEAVTFTQMSPEFPDPPVEFLRDEEIDHFVDSRIMKRSTNSLQSSTELTVDTHHGLMSKSILSPVKSSFPNSPSRQFDAPSMINLSSLPIPSRLGPDLAEEIRRHTGLSHDKSCLAVELVLSLVGNSIPQTATVMDKIIYTFMEQSSGSEEDLGHDATRLQHLFTELATCKDDSQQRSWALHEDQKILQGYLDELLSILENAKPSICRRAVSRESYTPVHNLVEYFQMEVRQVLRLSLLQVFGALCGLEETVISHLLYSVLPLELVNDILTNSEDVKRLSFVTLVLTMISCTGEPYPTTLEDLVNEDFIDFIFNLIEEPPTVEHNDQTTDLLVNLILAINLHYQTFSSLPNTIMEVLERRGALQVFTEKLLLLFNRTDDPCKMFEHQSSSTHSVTKFLTDIYSSSSTANILYTNDAKVLVDILVRQLTDLQPGDQVRSSMLTLTLLLVSNSDYMEEQHRAGELKTCLNTVLKEEADTPTDKAVAMEILQFLNGVES